MPPDLLRELAEELPRRFDAPVVIDPPVPPRDHWKVGAGPRFDAHVILEDLIAEATGDAGWRLALLDGNLVAPGIRSACGFATIGGCCAVVALAPILGDSSPGDTRAAFRRLLVEAVHEVGHLAGLAHCPDPACVMSFSSQPQLPPGKGAEFCEACRRLVGGT